MVTIGLWLGLEFVILTARHVQRVNMHNREKFHGNRSNQCQYMTIYHFFNMAAVGHLGFVVLDLLYACLDHTWTAFGSLCRCAKFGENRRNSFNNMHVFRFCRFG